MFKRFDSTLVEGDFLFYEDKGYVTAGAKTRRFALVNRFNHSLIGYVKYFAQWRQYTFFPLNCILNKDCLREIADFCAEVTTAHREKRKAFPTSA